MKAKHLQLLFFFLLIVIHVFAQKDGGSNQTSSGISPAILFKGHSEIQLLGSFGLFYTKSHVWTDLYSANKNQKVASFSPSYFYGLSNKINIGITYQLTSINETYLIEQKRFTSIYNSNTIGPQIRVRIFGENSQMEGYLESNILIPLDSYIPKKKFTYTNQFVATTRIGYDVMLSLQLGLVVFPKFSDENHPISLPANLFAGYLINNNIIPFFVIGQFFDFGSVSWVQNNNYYLLNYSTQAGLGLKYHVFRQTNFGLYYLNSIKSKNGDNFNNVVFQLQFLF